MNHVIYDILFYGEIQWLSEPWVYIMAYINLVSQARPLIDNVEAINNISLILDS